MSYPGSRSRAESAIALRRGALAELQRLEIERERDRQRIRDLTEALREAEWHGSAWVGMECCPVCSGERTEGHEPGCVVGAVLAGEKEDKHETN